MYAYPYINVGDKIPAAYASYIDIRHPGNPGKPMAPVS
jgi:hypothetical protein